MTLETTDHVPGIPDEQMVALADEAETGYDLGETRIEPNPHQGGHLVPEDLLEAVAERAERDGRSPDEVVRLAITRYLATA